jgi:hypothetical protein
MALTYAEKLEFSNNIKQKFTEIRELKTQIDTSIDTIDAVQYEYLINIVFSKMSVIETNLNNLKKLFLERL